MKTVKVVEMKTVNYIDPATGTAIIASIWPAILAFFSAIFAFLLKIFWSPIKKLFSRKRNIEPNISQPESKN